MVSIRKHLEPDAESLQILIRVAQVLVEGMAKHVVSYDPEAYDRFSSKMLDLAARFTEHTSGGDCLVQAGAAVRALEDYTELATLNVKNSRRELDKVVTLLTQTIAATTTAGSDSVHRLQQIEGQLSEAKGITDVRLLKGRLEDCLTTIRQEVKRRADETEQTAAALSREVQNVRAHPVQAPAPVQTLDPLTNLPSREQAEEVLSRMCAVPHGFVAVLTLDRLQLYNVRYGRTTGDNIFRFYAEMMKELSPANHRLFRWSGPTLVVLTSKVADLEQARAEIKRVQEHIPAYELELETRSASLALSSRWAVFPIVAAMATLLRKIDMFASIQGVRASSDADPDPAES